MQMTHSESKNTILLVDDDPQGLESARKILELAGFEVLTAGDGQEALDYVRKKLPLDLILTDVRMPRLGGLDFLRALSLCGDETPVILMTAFGRVEEAVWAMKLGAVDFLTKPFKRQALLAAVEMSLKRVKPRPGRPNSAAQGNHSSLGSISGSIIGSSEPMRELHAIIEQVAPTSATVLLTGESGTGKELAARNIHEKSTRAKRKFVAINCAAMPEQLMESELFGHEKGAFTGAQNSKEGLFEAAHEGTLFLDEVGDMPVSLQAKLLRVLQDNEVRRVGAVDSRKINVRLIAATHRNLKELVRTGAFREDLLYRLEVIGIYVPPLRERMADLPDLAYYFLKKSAQKHDKASDGILDEAMEVLLAHHWPGNVRELSNVIERAVVFTKGPHISLADLPAHLVQLAQTPLPAASFKDKDSTSISVPLGTSLKDVEELLIRKTLEATSGDKKITAKLLGINSRTIYRKLEKT